MNGKKLITSFFLANIVDAAVSTILLTQEGWRELNQFALAKIAQGQIHEVLLLKIAVTAVLIGCYALARNTNSRLLYPLERSLWVGSLVVWTVQIWNSVNLLATIALKFA